MFRDKQLESDINRAHDQIQKLWARVNCMDGNHVWMVEPRGSATSNPLVRCAHCYRSYEKLMTQPNSSTGEAEHDLYGGQ